MASYDPREEGSQEEIRLQASISKGISIGNLSMANSNSVGPPNTWNDFPPFLTTSVFTTHLTITHSVNDFV